MGTVLVVGTRNPKKRQELLEILGDGRTAFPGRPQGPAWEGRPTDFGLELLDLTNFPDAPEVVEDGETFEANASKKAVELSRYLGRWVLGEDSGLVVPILNGRPGVYSARYAGKQGDDEANNRRLLNELEALKPLTDEQRAAYYVCTVALANPQGEVKAVVEGRCHGRIIDEPRGSGGFGYDPLFLIPEYHQTFGELSSRVKHALSHRGRALAHLRPILRRLLT